MSTLKRINPLPFYSEWAGHPISDLTTIKAAIQIARPNKPIVYLAGDSSLDNKAWIPSSGPGGDPLPVTVPHIYPRFLDPASPKPDVAFWLNRYLGNKATVVNAAVEASLLREREKTLLHHDEFIRDNITSEDILIVSVGANDIALSPTTATMRHMLQLSWLTSKASIEAGTASSLGHFRKMFKEQMEDYISRLASKQKPRAVIVCTIYYPLLSSVSTQDSWADAQLQMLGYGRWPGQLQAAIRQIHDTATSKVDVEGVKVVPCALYEVMDGTREMEYVARVEPSVEGGRRMAELLGQKVDEILRDGG